MEFTTKIKILVDVMVIIKPYRYWQRELFDFCRMKEYQFVNYTVLFYMYITTLVTLIFLVSALFLKLV